MGLALGAILVVTSRSREARADSAAPPEYGVQVDGGTVSICPPNFGVDGNAAAACDDGSPMLRFDVDAGTVVELPQRCSDGCFVDLCVPPGSYEYGLEAAPSCVDYPGQMLPYFGNATVAPATSGTCTPPDGVVPTPYPGGAPWPQTSEGVVCPGGGCGCVLPRTGGPVGTVLGAQALTLMAGLILVRRRARRGRRGWSATSSRSR